MSYGKDRPWSDQYLPAVRAIVGPQLLVPAPLERDIEEATDLIVLRARDMTIAVRLRRPGYADKFPGEFTIRSKRATGAKTELRKIVDGWADWLFYGHTNLGGIIASWVLIDLHHLRAAFIRYPRILHDNQDIHNGDGTYFRAFTVSDLPTKVVVSCSDNFLTKEAA